MRNTEGQNIRTDSFLIQLDIIVKVVVGFKKKKIKEKAKSNDYNK